MEFIHQILLDTNFKSLLMVLIILCIITLTPPLNNYVYNFYNNIFGKILILALIIYYAGATHDDFNNKLSLLLTILYVLLMITVNTQDNILMYGKNVNKTLNGGSNNEDGVEDGDVDGVEDGDVDGDVDGVEDGDVDGDVDGVEDGDVDGVEDGDEEGDVDGVDVEDEEDDENEQRGGNKPSDLESTDEEDIDKKIEHIIQEEIVLNKKKHNNDKKHKKQLLNERKLGAEQYKLNHKYKTAKDTLDKQTEKYKVAEEEYNTIMKRINQYDTNNDGVVDYNDTMPEMEAIEEEFNTLEKEINHSMDGVKKETDELDKLVVTENTSMNGGDGNLVIEGYDNNLYSTV